MLPIQPKGKHENKIVRENNELKIPNSKMKLKHRPSFVCY